MTKNRLRIADNRYSFWKNLVSLLADDGDFENIFDVRNARASKLNFNSSPSNNYKLPFTKTICGNYGVILYPQQLHLFRIQSLKALDNKILSI